MRTHWGNGLALSIMVLVGLASAQDGWAQVINHSAGFSGETDMTLNGTPGPATISGTFLRVTDAGGGEARSAYETNPVAVGNFTNTFTFHILTGSTGGGTGLADGIGFCIQGNAPTALGAAGGQMGYSGVAKSVFVKFDPYGEEAFTARLGCIWTERIRRIQPATSTWRTPPSSTSKAATTSAAP